MPPPRGASTDYVSNSAASSAASGEYGASSDQQRRESAWLWHRQQRDVIASAQFESRRVAVVLVADLEELPRHLEHLALCQTGKGSASWADALVDDDVEHIPLLNAKTDA